MDAKVVNVRNRYGTNKALSISFKNREEFDDFLDIVKPVREDSVEYYDKRTEETGNNYASGVDVFLKIMERSYREKPNSNDGSKVDCTCLIFSNDFAELFWAFYDCAGTYYVNGSYDKRVIRLFSKLSADLGDEENLDSEDKEN